MPSQSHVRICFVTLGFVFLNRAASAQPYAISYEASTDLLPDDSCPAWILDHTGGSAIVGGGVLTISGGVQSHVLSYHVPVDLAEPVVVECRVRRVAGTTSSDAREQIGIAIGTATNIGVHFFVGPDVVFLTDGSASRGPEASIDSDVMHTYRIEVSGSAVEVFCDNLLTLTGSTFSSAEFPSVGITWGDFTNFADGTSEWEYFEHNSSAISCEPTSVDESSTTWGHLKSAYR